MACVSCELENICGTVDFLKLPVILFSILNADFVDIDAEDKHS